MVTTTSSVTAFHNTRRHMLDAVTQTLVTSRTRQALQQALAHARSLRHITPGTPPGTGSERSKPGGAHKPPQPACCSSPCSPCSPRQCGLTRAGVGEHERVHERLRGVPTCGSACPRHDLPALPEWKWGTIPKSDLCRPCGTGVTLPGLVQDLRRRQVKPVRFPGHNPRTTAHWHAYVQMSCATQGSHMVYLVSADAALPARHQRRWRRYHAGGRGVHVTRRGTWFVHAMAVKDDHPRSAHTVTSVTIDGTLCHVCHVSCAMYVSCARHSGRSGLHGVHWVIRHGFGCCGCVLGAFGCCTMHRTTWHVCLVGGP